MLRGPRLYRYLTIYSKKASPPYLGHRCMSSSVLNLRPTAESQRQWFDILQSSPCAPRSVVIDTYPDPYYTSNRHTDWGLEGVGRHHEPGTDYYRALSTLCQFPNVNEVSLRFTSDCAGARTEQNEHLSIVAEQYVLENRERRSKILSAFLGATAEHCRTTGNQRLQTLTVRNLQNTADENVTDSDDFRETVKHLKALHLQICTEWDDEHAYPMEDMRTFWPHLRSWWLEPLSGQLETLTLYWDTRWGLFPYTELRGLHFPNLRSLSLGTFVFGLDEQFQWLLSHKTLQHLSLDSCAICSNWQVPNPSDYYFQDELRLAQTKLPVAVPFDPEAGLAEPGAEWEFRYNGRWPKYLTQMAQELPELRRFQFGHNWDPWGDECLPKRRQDTRFDDRHLLSAEFKNSSYVTFVPSQGADGFEGSPLSEVYDCEEDEQDTLEETEKQALDDLLEVIGKMKDSEAL